MRALLLSNSTSSGSEMLEHAAETIGYLLAGVEQVTFVPYALHDWDAYTERAKQALAGVCPVVGAHRLTRAEVGSSQAFFVGGGNTFRLLDRLQQEGLVELIRQRVLEGARYMGASAGSVIAGPTIRTTNDMPIVEPSSFESLGLIGFQLNCHYQDPPTGPRVFMGETRDERLVEFLEDNDAEVVCLREGAWLDIEDDRVVLGGATGGKLFRRGSAPRPLLPGESGAGTSRWLL